MEGHIYIPASFVRIVQDKACCENCGRIYTPHIRIFTYEKIFTYGKLYLPECVNKYTSSSVALGTFLSSLNINAVFLMLKVTCSFSWILYSL